MLGLHLQQFADPGTRSAHEPDGEVPLVIPAIFEFPLEIPVVGVADHILQEGALRIFDPFYFKGIHMEELQILVERMQPQVHRFGLVVLEEEDLVIAQVFFAHPAVTGKKETDSLHVGAHGVLGEPRPLQERLEFSVHGFSRLS